MDSAPAIGIDLGTTFSAAAVYRNGKSEIIPNKEGNRLTPSFIFYHPNSLDVSVGSTADDLGPSNIENFLFDIKRIIGRKYDDVYIQKLKDSQEIKYKIVRGDDDKAEIELLHDGFTVQKSPEQASSEVLKYLRESADEYLGTKVTEAVISIPAHFSNAQRKATKAAAELAGLKVLKLISEPVAAAIHYTEEKPDIKGKILVFDFGGGTLDVSIIEIHDKKFTVKSVEGDTFLGGRDFDQILMEFFKSDMENKFANNVINDRLLRRVKNSCVRMKTKLSTEQKYDLPIHCIGGNENSNYTLSMSRSQFEELSDQLFKNAENLVKVCLKEAGLNKNDINEIVMVGGSTRIPKVRHMLSLFFNKDLKMDLNPDEAVALGTAIQAALIKDETVELEKYKITEVTPLSLGFILSYNLMLTCIKKNTPLPYKSHPYSTKTMENNQKSATFIIVEGERKNCKFNNKLGSFTIHNLPPGKSGDIGFETIFSLNEDGILEVESFETSTEQRNKLIVTIGEYRLCENKIKTILEDAEKNIKEDEIFENFTLYKQNIREKCLHILYDVDKILLKTDRQFVKKKCMEFKDKINSISDFMQIDKLKREYKTFRKSVKGIIDGVLSVNLSGDNDDDEDVLTTGIQLSNALVLDNRKLNRKLQLKK